MRSFILHLALLASLVTCARAAQDPELASPPDWIKEAPELKKQSTAQDGSYRYHLIDLQYHAETKETYQHFVISILNESGVKSFAQIDIDFQPDYQKLYLHHITIERDGSVVDKLEGAKIETLRREKNLDRQLYDGDLTALIVLEDVQPGDILSYAFTTQGENPVYQGRAHKFFSLGFSLPCDHIRRSVVWNKKQRNIEWKLLGNTSIEPKLEQSNEVCQLTWQHRDASSIEPEDYTPGWHYDYPYLQITDFKSWEEFGNWAIPLYDNRDALPDEIVDLCRSLREQHPKDEECIIAVLDWVKRNIRYLGSFIGEHTHRPHPLSLIYQRKFGDCKDKGLLTVAMLRELGYDAAPALVHTTETKSIAENLPSSTFNHLVVHLNHKGTSYILDPTYTYQRGSLHSLSVPDYGYAFILREGADQLTPVSRRGAEADKLHIREIYRVPNKHEGAELEVITIATGGEANALRAYFADNTHDDIIDAYLDFYADDHERIEISKPLEFIDDESANRIEVHEFYRLPVFWQQNEGDEQWFAELSASYLKSRLRFPDNKIRTKPLHHEFPLNIHHTIEARMPEEWPMDASPVTVEHEAFHYQSHVEQLPKGFIFHHKYRALANTIQPEEFESFRTSLQKVSDDLGWQITHSDSPQANKNGNADHAFGLTLVGSGMAIGCLLGLIVAVLFWFWDPAPRTANPDAPVGLSGWMILPLIGVCMQPLFILQNSSTFFTSISTITETLETSEYAGWWQLNYFVSTLLNAFLLILAILQLVLLFLRRTSFPYLFILISFAMLAFEFIFIMLEQPLKDMEESGEPSLIGAAILRCAIWVSYMLISQRVRATFTTRRKGKPSGRQPPAIPANEGVVG